MIYVEVQGARVPALGLGTWQLRGEECRRAVATAIEIGYRHIDTAVAYENEQQVGEGIRNAGVGREEIFLTTKVPETNLRPADVRQTFEGSLRRLNMDYVDLLLIHWPNEAVPLEQTLDAMLEIKEGGGARHIGVSNFTPDLFRRAVSHAPVFCNQVEYHPFLDQDDLLDLARQHDAMLTAYSPIARGRVVKDKSLQEIARRHGKSPVQVALRWLVQQNNVSAIPKSASPDHLRSNFDLFDFDLDEDEMERINALARGERLVDPASAPWR